MRRKLQIIPAITLCLVALVSGGTRLAGQMATTAPKRPADQASATPPQSPIKADTTAAPPQGSAVVDFHDGLLHIVATDADLNSVLQQVSRLTGMRLQGSTNGDRLYGDYGPAASVDVISRMLDGLPYNFVMTQAPDTAAPQQLVISLRNGAPSAPSPANGANPASASAPQPSAPEPLDSTNPEEGQPDPDMQSAEPPQEEPPPPDNTGPPTDNSDPDKPTATPGAKTPEQFLEELRQMHQNGRPPQ